MSVVVGLMPFAHAADWMSDTWVATDGLGRQLPLAAEVGAPKDRQVLMFYFLWAEANKPGPFDMSKALAADPELMSHPNSPLFGPPFAFSPWTGPISRCMAMRRRLIASTGVQPSRQDQEK